MGAGLTAAGAGAAGATAAPMTASQSLSQAGQGLTAIGADTAKRAAFAKSVGMSGLGMAAAPMMAPGKKPGETPVDDEMYYTEYNPGQTGKRSSTSSEALQFSGGYSPMEKIKADDYMERRNRQYFAAKGGLMSLAEGGEVADAAPADAGSMTGASKAAFDYLMGNAPTSRDPAPQLMQGIRAVPMSTPGVGTNNMYAFDPVTGTFLRNPNVPGAETSGSRVGTSFAGIGGGGGYDAPMSQQTIDFFDREAPAQREARMGEVNNIFSLGPIAQVANAVTGSGLPGRAPDFGMLFGTSDAYKNLGYDYYQGEGGTKLPSGLSYAEAVGMGSNMAQDDRDRGEVGFSQSATSQQAGENVSDYGPDPQGMDYSGYSAADYGYADGGIASLAKGGMKSGGFVVPADVVSMVGEGNTDAGYNRIKSMIPGATAIKGKDGGQADTVKTSIEGKQPARVAHGEMYIPPETVKRMGGAKKLYAMMDRVREQATGSKKQIKPVSLKRAMA
jgi:hypothetical protein